MIPSPTPRLFFVAAFLALAGSAGPGAESAAPPTPPAGQLKETLTKNTGELRGFGQVQAQGWLWQTPAGEVSLVRLTGQDEAHAQIVAAKYLADLLGYGAVQPAPTPAKLGGTAVMVRHGGVWLLGLTGATVQVAAAPTEAALASAARAWGAAEWKVVPAGAYPRYLDNFDNAGLALWWMPTTKPPEQMQFMAEHSAVFNIHGQSLDMAYAPGVYNVLGTENALAQASQLGKPHRQMLWSGSPAWFDYLHLPGHNWEEDAPGLTGHTFLEAGGYYREQIASPYVNTVLQDALVSAMRRLQNDPQLMAWMEPHGEFQLKEPTGLPPDYQRRYPDYLQQVKGYELAELAARYTGEPRAYRDWTEVPFPDTAYFWGRRGSYLDLDDQPWRWRQGPQADGEKAGWTTPEFADAEWGEAPRQSKQLLSRSSWWSESQGQSLALWYRFRRDVPGEYLRGLKGRAVFLHLLPYTEGQERGLSVWLNGQPVLTNAFEPTNHINVHVQAEVTDLLRPGENQFVICSPGGRIDYRVFLSDQPGEKFPFYDSGLNRRYLDWRDYLVWEKFQTLESYLKLMRAVDPVRPIKVMTPHLFQTEAMALFERYGAYPQLTGETNWYRPMHYKGYARLRGLPASSEPGGPQKTARATQVMFSNIFWESQDCHDYVFDLTRDLWPYPEVVQWWRDNRPLLRTLGKTDFAAPQLGLLRDTRQDGRYATGEIWNWDLARGPLPAIGLSPVLVDGPELELGTADRLPVIMDCATTIMEPGMVQAVRRYVEAGGVFITQHHTGRHSAERRDSWPLARAFGLEIEPRLVTPGRVWDWPLGKLKFAPDQNLFPSLRGKTCEGAGVAIDWKGNQYAGAIAIDGRDFSPVATWEDGKCAIAEVRRGRGRLIVVGTPFFLRFKDENGRWMNDDSRQGLLRELLAAVKVDSGLTASDNRLWYEHRESKNGLYDVYFAGALQIKGDKWKLTDRIESELTAAAPAAAPAIDATAADQPDVPTSYADGALRFARQQFAPFQVRQLAVVRPEAGLRGPLHWLEVQARAWRPLTPEPPAASPDQVVAETKRIAGELGEDGLELVSGWQVRRDPERPDEADWLKTLPQGGAWSEGQLGSWLARGWTGAKRVQYRRRVELPADWTDGRYRVFLGFDCPPYGGAPLAGGTARLWLNGRPLLEKLPARGMIDITPPAAAGPLELALEIAADPSGPGVTHGPLWDFYLRRSLQAKEKVELTGGHRWLAWDRLGPEVALPLKEPKLFGLQLRVKIPAAWAGKPVRMTITQPEDNEHGRVGMAIINSTGYFREQEWAPLGSRIDRWLKPGEENILDLYGVFHDHRDYAGFRANLEKIELEVLE